MSKSYFTSHTEPRMKELGLMKLEDLYNFQCTTLIHDIAHRRAPTPMATLVNFDKDIPRQGLRSHVSNPNRIRVPIGRSRAALNGFRCKGPLTWNKLPFEMQNVKEKLGFKLKLKRHILSSYSTEIVCNNPRCTDRAHHH